MTMLCQTFFVRYPPLAFNSGNCVLLSYDLQSSRNPERFHRLALAKLRGASTVTNFLSQKNYIAHITYISHPLRPLDANVEGWQQQTMQQAGLLVPTRSFVSTDERIDSHPLK